MPNAITSGLSARRLIVAALIVALGLSSTAVFRSPEPGGLLSPVGDATRLVQLMQGQSSILWTSPGGIVDTYLMLGWPSSDGSVDLGGALVIEKVEADAGVITFAERPMSLEFDLGG
ncbi:MAG: hypothetical protein WD269_00305 [Acidimicrobiia bacterium]